MPPRCELGKSSRSPTQRHVLSAEDDLGPTSIDSSYLIIMAIQPPRPCRIKVNPTRPHLQTSKLLFSMNRGANTRHLTAICQGGMARHPGRLGQAIARLR